MSPLLHEVISWGGRRTQSSPAEPDECLLVVELLSHVRFFTTPWTSARQAPLSMGFPRQEYWSGWPFPSPWVFSRFWNLARDYEHRNVGTTNGIISMTMYKAKITKRSKHQSYTITTNPSSRKRQHFFAIWWPKCINTMNTLSIAKPAQKIENVFRSCYENKGESHPHWPRQ